MKSSYEISFGELFEAVQSQRIFEDSKTFVDCTPKSSAQSIMGFFEFEKNNPGFDLKQFVLTHFELPPHLTTDFESDTSQSVEEHINRLWSFLKRTADEKAHEDSSLLALPHPYIVPGGRFGEIYYWDSYFTMLGLKESGEIETIENMVDNFSYMIDTIGYIPNGNRTYFFTRSQPPFFALMVDLLASIKGESIYEKYYAAIEKEYNYWQNTCSVSLGLGNLNRYWDDATIPRQESYFEDIELAEHSTQQPKTLYRHLRAACASGWDFSSRWLDESDDLKTIKAANIIPVDLNALLYKYELILSTHAKEEAQKTAYSLQAEERKRLLLQYCYSEEEGCFFDYNFSDMKKVEVTSAAAFFPLSFNMVSDEVATAVVRTMQKTLLKDGGWLTTNIYSGQQWDAPNGWPPLQWMAYVALRNYNFDQLAKDGASRWLSLNEKVFKSTGKMMEKYNVVDINMEAGGGEYPVQDGFGWTNGVYLALHAAMNNQEMK